MRRTRVWFVATFLFVVTLPVSAAAAAFTVPGTANLFGAGHTAPRAPIGSPGVLPFEFAFAAGPGQTFAFTNVAGRTDCVGGSPSLGPDGGFCIGGPGTNVFSTSGISGAVHFGRQMFLAGVFTNGTEPSDPAPARLDFTHTDSFADLSPQLNQSFFIGDGLTGTGTGSIQKFHAPANASRLFLGFIDSTGFGTGSGSDPGAYGDNTGELTGTLRMLPEPQSIAPEPDAFVLIGIGICMLCAYRLKQHLAEDRQTALQLQ